MSTRINDINQLDAETKRLCVFFLEGCKRAGLNVKITETYRSQERQNELYAQGRTKPGKVVTQTKSSYHTTRRAFDICRNVKGREFDDSDGFFGKCAKIGKALGLNPGYFWTGFQDKPHYQLDRGKKGVSDEKANAFLTAFGVSASDKSTGDENGLKRQLIAQYGFSSETAEYILAFPKFGAELARKLLQKEAISEGAKRYLLAYKHGKEILRRVYGS